MWEQIWEIAVSFSAALGAGCIALFLVWCVLSLRDWAAVRKSREQRIHDDLNKHEDSIRELNKDVTLLLTDVRDIWGKINDPTPADNKTGTREPVTVAEVFVAAEECRDTDKVDQFCLDEDGDLFKWCAVEARSYIVYEGVSGPFWDVFGTSYDEYLRYRHTPITRQQAERLSS